GLGLRTGPGQVGVLGWSMGGGGALRLAEAPPERLGPPGRPPPRRCPPPPPPPRPPPRPAGQGRLRRQRRLRRRHPGPGRHPPHGHSGRNQGLPRPPVLAAPVPVPAP